ncbi:exonuclease V a 5' deoxyribonuclease-domain-containing protein [Crepidotus variabilis]|uniref:Exonuclease V a 5' deoxyribonuclease-domain-containing protein n=1 Tax=Crepidotus variabilis TaxID=179855 RepID=A0A9P6EMS5_9AGAR|nr:exonuclease V a 5' deoxyribonuclease-domain-containing protein [Crepidotus variabilis]
MSCPSSDYGPDLFATFTPEDFEQVDAVVDTALCTNETSNESTPEPFDSSFQSEIGGLNLRHLTSEEWAKVDATATDIEDNVEEVLDASFRSELEGLDFKTLNDEDLARIDKAVQQVASKVLGPKIDIALEEPSEAGPSVVLKTRPPQTTLPRSLGLLEEFRPSGVLSVTDLVAPTWCEVQYEYGLRGKRSRPIESRPASFQSASGNIIKVEQPVAEKNYVRTRQGLAIHKEFEREIRAETLQVDITTKETLWALRLVNMLACMTELLEGSHLTREMPIFGILHGRIIVGIIDEVRSEINTGTSRKRAKPTSRCNSTRPKKRASLSVVEPSASVLEGSHSTETESPQLVRMHHNLFLLDAKTRKHDSIPNEEDSRAGRLQLFVYRKLLCDLLKYKKPEDFYGLWQIIDVNYTARLPTTFLVQAQLVRESEDFKTVSLDDLAQSWCKLINKVDISVSLVLELRYYKRPPVDLKGKQKEIPKHARKLGSKKTVSLPSNVAGPSTSRHRGTALGVEEEDVAMQWALEESIMNHSSLLDHHSSALNQAPVTSEIELVQENDSIRRFPLVGSKTFFSDQVEMDTHISDVLRWWRGERPPRGVSIEFTWRCRTCEYANDCEWRSAKAQELTRKKTL